MNMFGSNYWDTLIGTTGVDTIHARLGNDLISTNGGRDRIFGDGGNDLISGFSFDLNKISGSPSRGAFVDGGSGFDTLILDVSPASGISVLAKAAAAMTINNVDENIYNVGPVTSKQLIIGTKKLETICTSGDAVVRGMEGNDYIFTVNGDDALSGGDGNDYLSGGLGHNTLSGGAGSDFFAFKLETDKGYQYSNIEDFQNNSDKIAILVGVEQFNLIYRKTLEERGPDRYYGDGVQGVGGAINDYVSYNNGRHIDREDFQKNSQFFQDFVIYEQSTGSVLLKHYQQIDENTLFRGDVLVAHIDGNPRLDADDFRFELF